MSTDAGYGTRQGIVRPRNRDRDDWRPTETVTGLRRANSPLPRISRARESGYIAARCPARLLLSPEHDRGPPDLAAGAAARCPEPFGEGPQATAAAVAHLGYVQIDTINVIERCHHHILWTRIPDYRRADLRQAQSVDKSVFEYWTHALSYVPSETFAFSSRR